MLWLYVCLSALKQATQMAPQAKGLKGRALIDSARFFRRAKKAGAMLSCTSRREVAEQIWGWGLVGGDAGGGSESIVAQGGVVMLLVASLKQRMERPDARLACCTPRNAITLRPTCPTVQKMPNMAHSTAFSMSASSNTSSAAPGKRGCDAWASRLCSRKIETAVPAALLHGGGARAPDS